MAAPPFPSADRVPKVIGHRVVELEHVPSTNTYAAEQLALSQVVHGTVILAHDQTAGRGQRGRVWRSAPGLDLTFSVVLAPAGLRADGQFVLARLAALAVHDTVDPILGGRARVKWPNDILVDDRKLAGILIQNELRGEQVAWAIVGIGINVNSRSEGHDTPATSLLLETGRSFDRRELLASLCGHLETRWNRWTQSGDGGEADYLQCLWGRHETRWFELDGRLVQARAVGVDPSGRLRLQRADGQEEAFGLDRLRFGPR
jgi:BirA family biotin operon repressor/biotin-[acetyl-CoA-carboxylase] ligase